MFDPCISHYSIKPKISYDMYLWFVAVVRNAGIKHKLGVTCLATSSCDMSHLWKSRMHASLDSKELVPLMMIIYIVSDPFAIIIMIKMGVGSRLHASGGLVQV